MLTLVSKETKVTVRKRQTQGEEFPPCPTCRETVVMITAEHAAVICQCSRRRIYRWIEDGLHFVEKSDGTVFVCGRSLGEKLELLNSFTDRLDYTTQEMPALKKAR
jgi:hypothetical protein